MGAGWDGSSAPHDPLWIPVSTRRSRGVRHEHEQKEDEDTRVAGQPDSHVALPQGTGGGNSMRFNSVIRRLGVLRDVAALRSGLKDEPMFFGASAPFIGQHDAPITRALLGYAYDYFGADFTSHMVVDTRVHMLMPGWYPCIPGWHHDDVARTRSDGQPNYAEQPYYASHLLFVMNADIAPTEFALGEHELPDVAMGEKVYQTWHPLVENQIGAGLLTRAQVGDCELVGFDWQAMHRGVPAVKAGWRYFFRASVRRPRHRNEVRRQVQVYVPGDINQGW